MSSILEVRNLAKQYGDFTAVKGISFDIKEGEIFSLLGPNGAGKTTTISMLSTLYVPTSGDAMIGGHSISKNPMAVKQVIGVVPQEIALYEDLTAHENLIFWGQMYGLSGKSLNSRVDEVLEQIGLTDKDLNKQGMTVLYTTHYMEEAEELSDRVGIIDHGELIAIGTQKELTQQIGQTETLVLHLGETDDAQSLAKSLHGVKDILEARASDHEVSVMAHEAEDVLATAVTKANERGIKIRSIDIHEPNL